MTIAVFCSGLYACLYCYCYFTATGPREWPLLLSSSCFPGDKTPRE